MSKLCVACKQELRGTEVYGARCTSCLQDRVQFLAELFEGMTQEEACLQKRIRELEADLTNERQQPLTETKYNTAWDDLRNERDQMKAALVFLNAHGIWTSMQWLVIDHGVFIGCPWCRGRVHRNEKYTIDSTNMHEPSCLYRRTMEFIRALHSDSASADGE